MPITVVKETDKFSIELEPKPDGVALRPIGGINESAKFDKTFQTLTQAGVKLIAIDTSKLTAINSVGIREWIIFMDKIKDKMMVRFQYVNELFLEQANIVPKVLGKEGNALLNFDAPFFCGKCNLRAVKVLKTSDIKKSEDGEVSLPEFKCEKCGGALEFDQIEEEYFVFLDYVKRA